VTAHASQLVARVGSCIFLRVHHDVIAEHDCVADVFRGIPGCRGIVDYRIRGGEDARER